MHMHATVLWCIFMSVHAHTYTEQYAQVNTLWYSCGSCKQLHVVVQLFAVGCIQQYSINMWQKQSKIEIFTYMGLLVALSENAVQCLIGEGCKYCKNANFIKPF